MGDNLFKEKLQQFKLWLAPESIVLKTEWADDWLDEHYRSYRKVSIIGLLLTTVIYMAHYPLFDVPMGLEPIDFWFKMRLYTSAVFFLMAISYFIPQVSFGRFHRLPVFISALALCWVQGQVMIWWEAGSVSIEYCMAFVLAGVIYYRGNVASTIIVGILLNLSILAPALETGADLPRFISNAVVTLLIGIVLRLPFKADIQTFVLQRQQQKLLKQHHETQQQIMKKELELTGAVQSLLLPETNDYETPDGKVKLSGYYRSATQCGGDWWWFKPYKDKLRVVIGDVTGHGAGPAVVTATVSSFIKVLENEETSMSDLMHQLRSNYQDYFKESLYWMTMCSLEVDLKTGEVYSYFAAAPPIFTVENGESVQAVQGLGSHFGNRESITNEKLFKLEKGGRIMIVTDGLFESKITKSGREIGMRRFSKFIEKNRDLSAKDSINAIVNKVDELREDEPQDDDFTCVVVDIAPSA